MSFKEENVMMEQTAVIHLMKQAELTDEISRYYMAADRDMHGEQNKAFLWCWICNYSELVCCGLTYDSVVDRVWAKA